MSYRLFAGYVFSDSREANRGAALVLKGRIILPLPQAPGDKPGIAPSEREVRRYAVREARCRGKAG
jgi:hypothetical protein